MLAWIHQIYYYVLGLYATFNFLIFYSAKTPTKKNTELKKKVFNLKKKLYLPAILKVLASIENPVEPSGPFGALTTVKRGALSSIELILIREIKRSGRGDTSWILTTPHADVFPVR